MPFSIKNSAVMLKDNGTYSPIDAFFLGDVSNWLDSHPEVTTTVQDGSISESKLSSALKIKTLNNYVTPYMYGAVGDGQEDDTQALVDCSNYCYNNNVPLVIPEDCKIKIPEKVTLNAGKQIYVYGKIIAPEGIVFRGNSSQTLYDWYFNDIEGVDDSNPGALILEGLKDGFVKIINADAVILHADSSLQRISSIAYMHFFFGYVKSLTIQGEGSGWINENFFYGGRIKSLIFADGGSYAHNNNHFFNNSFESCYIEFYRARSNYIHNARFEDSPENRNTIIFHSNASMNFIQKSWLGESLPNISDPNFIDENGSNYYYVGVVPPIKVYEKNLTPYSFNYNTDKAYPLNGKLHCVPYQNKLLETNLIPIEKGVSVYLRSDVSFFRVTVTIYDSNKQKITTAPSKSPFYPDNLLWNSSESYYYVGDTNQQNFKYSIRKRSYNGVDSDVSYIKISVQGYGAPEGSNIEGLYFSILASQERGFTPFKPDRLEGTSAPAAGDWEEGTMVYNVDPTKSVFGWYYNNNSWHEIGLT